MRSTLAQPAFLRTLERLVTLARRLFSGELRARRERARGASLEFEEYRDYAPGDDLRLVDWNVWQRLDQLAVKRFRAERELVLTLLIDTTGSMGTGAPSKFEQARRLAAALGFVGLHLGFEVMLVPLPYRSGAPLRAMRGPSQAPRLLAATDELEAAGGGDPEGSLRALLGRHHGRGRAVWLSDMATPSGWAEAFRYLAVKGLQTDVLHLLAPDELDPPLPLDGTLRLRDPEAPAAERLELEAGAGVRALYRQRLERHLGAVAAAARASGLGYQRTASDADLEATARALLERGSLLR